MAHRNEHLESSIQRLLGGIIAEGLSDPRIQGIISVTGVKLNRDTHEAMVYISVLPEDKQQTTLQGLISAAGHLQALVGRQLHTRSVPRLRFVSDNSLKKQAEVLDEIRKAVNETNAREDVDSAAESSSPRSSQEPSP